MTKVIIENASNGVIKTIIDENANGAGDGYEERKVYDFENDGEKGFENTITFLNELVQDLGIFLGNEFSKDVVESGIRWGNSYRPSEKEIKDKIREYKNRLEELENLLK